MDKILEIYKDRLVNLSARNRTLVLKKLYKKRSFDLKVVDRFFGEGYCDDVLYKTIVTGEIAKAIVLPTLKNIKNKDEEKRVLQELLEKMNSNITSLHKEIVSVYKEKGSYDLYVGYPFIEGYFDDGTFVKAPLLLFPARLEFKKNEVHINRIKDDNIIINKTFIMGYEKYNGIDLPEFDTEIDENEEEEITDLLAYALEFLKENGIEIKRDNLKDNKLEKFSQYTKDTMPDIEKGELHIVNNMILGQFPISNSAMYKDYISLIKNGVSDSELVRDLISAEEEMLNSDEASYDFIDQTKINENDSYYTTELDYSQQSAVISTNHNKELVIYGPPGTGKSQVIVNLIMDSLAKGKKVLMVSQKKAAIDVVYNRLAQFGIQDRVALVHDFNQDRKSVFPKIVSVLESQEQYERQSLDEDFELISNQIQNELNKLDEVATILYKETPFGLNLWSLYSNSVNELNYYIDEIADNFTNYEGITYGELKQSLDLIESAFEYLHYDFVESPIKYRRDYSDFPKLEAQKIGNVTKDTLEKIDHYIGRRNGDEYLVKLEMILEEKGISGNKIIEELPALINQLELMGEVLSSDLLGKYTDIKISYENAKVKKMFSTRYWKARNDLKYYLPNLTHEERITVVENTIRLREYIKKIQFDYGIDGIKEDWSKEQILRELKGYQNGCSAIGELKVNVNKLDKYYQTKYIDQIIERVLFKKDYESSLLKAVELIQKEFESIQYFEEKKKSFTQRERDFIKFGINKYGEDAKALKNMFKAIYNTFYLMHIGKVESENKSILNNIFEEDKIRNTIIHKMNRKKVIVPELIKQRLNLEIESRKTFNRVGNDTNYRNMKYEASKKRKRLTLRKYVKTFMENGLMSVIPCWLVTPETVSTIFPLTEGLFDIIIFDEASQLFVENSIPAIYRAKRAVIGGDDKQLQPNDLYEVKLDEHEEQDEFDDYEDNTSVEAKSLLDLAKFKYKNVMLSYHYRSRHEELINFSNYAFYDRRVQIIPNRQKDYERPPIERIMVDGKWDKQTNDAEARRILELVKEILTTREREETIGIITFNSKQKDYIEELFEEAITEDEVFGSLLRQERDRKDGDEDISLFVKNIENVQGDERDIIIFSIGYARNEEGKVSRNFGSLSTKSGENRLNVAISRAKRKIYIVTSIEPEELGNVDNLSRGAYLLKKYLQYTRAVSDGNKDESLSILNSLSSGDVSSESPVNSSFGFEEDVHDELTKRGYKVDMNVGTSTYKLAMAVYDDETNEYILGIECDGAMYRNSKSVRERDIYRRKFLLIRGWKVTRVWSRSWWQNKDREINRLVQLIEESRGN